MKKRTDIGYHDYIVSLYYDPENPLSRTESIALKTVSRSVASRRLTLFTKNFQTILSYFY